jgi:hypothetical protein
MKNELYNYRTIRPEQQNLRHASCSDLTGLRISTEFKPSKSRLLNLPPEVRNIIWSMVLGDKAIHLMGHHERLLVRLCQSNISQVCHKMFVDKDPDWKYFGAKSLAAAKYADLTNNACVESHDLCRKWVAPGQTASLTAFDLNFLRCCRQAHFETKLIPYLSNNFIFENGSAFILFLHKIGPAQAKAITSITLQLDCNDRVHRFSKCGLVRPHIGYWNVALNPSLVKKLVGLKNLQVNLQECNEEYESFDEAIKLGPLIIGAALSFGRLSLETVKTIVVNGPRVPRDWEKEPDDEVASWTLEARQTLANAINNGLQQPNPHCISRWEELQLLCEGLEEEDFRHHVCFERRAIRDL